MSGGGDGEQPASFQHLVDTMPGAVFLIRDVESRRPAP